MPTTLVRQPETAPRKKRRIPPEECATRAFEASADAWATIDSAATPGYNKGVDATTPVYTRQTGAADGDPNAAAPAVADTLRDAENPRLAWYWKNDAGATRVTIDLTWWALNDVGDWVKVAVETGVTEFEELRAGPGLRVAFPQITAIAGGAGDVVLVAGPE